MSSRVYILGRSWQSYIDLGSGDPLQEDVGSVWLRESPTHDAILEGDAFSDYNTWNALSDAAQRWKKLYLCIYHKTTDQRMMIVEEDAQGDQDYIATSEYPVWCLIESPDYDLGRPDISKVFTQLSAKTFTNMTDSSAPLTDNQTTFELRLSPSYGYTWKRPHHPQI